MSKARRITLVIVAALLFAYFTVAYSPIKNNIGRRSPSMASLFSPPFFNFSHIYVDGGVLEFGIGMGKNELFGKLNDKYAGRADLTVNCTVTTADSVVPITSDLDIAAVYGGGRRFCVRLDSRRLVVDFQFREQVVSAIGVVFVRNESL